MPDLAITKLDDLAVIGIRGADSINFLQGQLSQDLTRLDDGGALLAGLHSPQGRTIALPRVLRITREHFLLVVPGDLADTLRQTLTRYVLRARVSVEDAGATWRVYGATGPDAAAAGSTRLSVPLDADGFRQLVLAPRGEPLPDGDHVERESWRLDDIADGLPEIGAATSGLFVAQMLNLDLIGGIAFDKGCYTGQEVIARAHYRGQVKRRMQRFFADAEQVPAPGSRLRLPDGRTAQLVMSAPGEDGGREFLAVTTPPPADAASQAAEEVTTADTESTAPLVPCVQLSLPYALPG